MIGILTEKPSAMRNFAKALRGAKGTYNGEAYELTAARGHLYGLKSPELQVPASLTEKYKSWNLDNLPWDEKQFKWERAMTKGASATLKSIKSVLSKCDEIVIASDDDPTGEGSLLAWEIIDELGLSRKKISRMYFVDEAPKSIQDAFKNRKSMTTSDKDPDYVKAWYRQRWDFLSMQFTRISTKNGNGQAVLRNGRLKSVMNLLVGQQLDAVNNYKKIPSYENRFKDENGVVYSSAEEPQYKNKDDVPNKYKPSAVVLDSKTMKRSGPSKLLDLAGLSAMLSSSGYKADQVLATYQKMYEAQIVSYPRTEDKVVTPEQFNELLPLIHKIAGVVGVDTSLLTVKTPRKTHVKKGGSHGANRPGTNVPKSLSDLSKYGPAGPKIYEILAKNYLAMHAEDYEYEQQKGHIKDYPDFKGSVNVPKSMGFKLVFSDVDETDQDENSQGLGNLGTPFVHEGFPPKPQYPTMKWLMKQLEKYDVGTGATRTSTYADVTSNKGSFPLLKEAKGRISMTEFGDMNYRLLPGTNIGDLTMTESVMKDMKDIAEGKKNAEACLADVQRLVREDKITMNKNGEKMRKELGVTMTKKFERNEADYAKGSWNGKEVQFKKVIRGYSLTDAEVEKLLKGGAVRFNFTSAAGNPYKMDGKLANLEFKGRKYVGVDLQFSEEVPDKWSGRKFSDEEKIMLEQGSELELEGFVSKRTGKEYTATIRYGEGKDGRKKIIPSFSDEF